MRAAFCNCLPALVLTALLSAGPSHAKEGPTSPTIRLTEGKDLTTVDVTGLDRETLAGLSQLAAGAEKWAKVFRVYVDRGGKSGDEQLAMLGASRVEKGVLRFTPRFPLVRGVRYRVVFNPAALDGGKGKPVEVVLFLPKPMRKPTTVVSKVYPSADKLPENQLKFYLHFSAPMSQGDSYRHIKLLDAKGKPVDLPFLELDQELWDRAGVRLTVFIDPGRIKRGLKPREEAGPVLEEGKRYTLVIDEKWTDAEGARLKEPFKKSFTVGPPDEAPPDPKTWKLKAPRSGASAPLRVTFPKSMDHALMERLVWVVDSSGKKVAGKAAATERETVWEFTPEQPWRGAATILLRTAGWRTWPATASAGRSRSMCCVPLSAR